MIFLLETKLSEKKPLFFELQNIYGIGTSKSLLLSKQLGFSKNFKSKDLSTEQISQLLKLIENSDLIITNDLKKLKNAIVIKLVSMKSYRGLRKIKGLPVRGQRTHTNAKTARKIRR
jgi:small subunit ribosomal protein S13